MLTSIPYSPTLVPKMSWGSPNGMIAKAATAVQIEIPGARAKRTPTEVVGRDCSLLISLAMSARGWRIP